MVGWTARLTRAIGSPDPGSRCSATSLSSWCSCSSGRRSHHEDAGLAGFLRVWWPFLVGLLVAWLVTGLWRVPLAWPRAIGAWLATVAVGMALRIAIEGRDFKIAFTIVTLVFVGVGMLGWRAVVRWRRSRIHTTTA